MDAGLSEPKGTGGPVIQPDFHVSYLTFLIGAAGLIIGITEKEKSYATLLVIAGVLFLIGFVALVKWHSVVAERQEMLTEKWEVCRRYCNRFTDGWRKFEEKGTVYLREDDCVAADIDLL